MKRILSLVIALSLLLTTTSIASADEGQGTLMISPASVQIELKPGETYRGKMTVSESSGAVPVKVSLYAEPFSISEDDYENPDFINEKASTKIKDWISFEQEIISLAPGESREVEFTINVPSKAAGGGQYAVIFAETVADGALAEGETGLQVSTRLGMLVYAKVAGEVNLSGKLTDHKIPKFASGKEIAVSFEAENDGNVDYEVRYKVEANPVFMGTPIPPVKDDVTILPETKRTVKTALKGATPGIYEVSQTIELLGRKSEYKETVIVAPVWFIIALAAILLVIIGTIITVISLLTSLRAQRSNPVQKRK
jgi:hypothetical protein